MKQPDQLRRRRPTCRDSAFVVVAAGACPNRAELRAAVFAANDVIHLAAPKCVFLVKETSPVDVVGAVGNLSPEPFVNPLAMSQELAGAGQPHRCRLPVVVQPPFLGGQGCCLLAFEFPNALAGRVGRFESTVAWTQRSDGLDDFPWVSHVHSASTGKVASQRVGNRPQTGSSVFSIHRRKEPFPRLRVVIWPQRVARRSDC